MRARSPSARVLSDRPRSPRRSESFPVSRGGDCCGGPSRHARSTTTLLTNLFRMPAHMAARGEGHAPGFGLTTDGQPDAWLTGDLSSSIGAAGA
jgi:hypothetical protein